MKQTTLLILILAFTSLISCEKSTNVDTLTDSEFLDYISNNDYKESIKRIDSLANAHTYSIHKTGLLYFEKGRILGILEKDVDAIGSLTKALELFEKEGNQLFIAKTNMLLSDSNAFLSKNDVATKQINIALKIFSEIKDRKGEAKALNSIAHVEFQNNNFEKSIQYVKQAALIQKEINDVDALSASYNNIGYILESSKDFARAKDYYLKAINLNKESNRLNSNALRNLGYVYLTEGNIEKCRALYLEALEIEEEAGVIANQKDIYDLLLELSIKDKSLINSSFYMNKRDSINQILVKTANEEKIKLIKDQYNLIAKETELKQEKKNNTKNKIIYGILIGLLSSFGLFLFQKNRNAKLKADQQKLMLEQKMLRIQMNPHFVFNALTAIQKTFFDEDPIKASTYLSGFAKLVRQNFEVVNKKQITLEEDLDILKNYIETQQMRFENKFDYEIKLSDEIEVSLIEIPPMLLQPFIENSIEHGLKPKSEKGFLQISIVEEGKFTRIEIIDNGIGYQKKRNQDDREHAIDIFLKRLKLRNFGEEKLFSIQALEDGLGTIVTIYLDLRQ